MVVSQMSVSDTEGTVGLYAHELLHNLGVGHTQKRPGKEIKQLTVLVRICITSSHISYVIFFTIT